MSHFTFGGAASLVAEIPSGPANLSTNATIVRSKADLPATVSGVITLPADSSWLVVEKVDLEGDRIVCAGVASIVGLGPETTGIESAISAGQVLIATTSTITLRALSLDAPAGATAVSVVGDGSTTAVDWDAVNFTGAATSVYFENVNNAIMNLIGWLNPDAPAIVVAGTVATLGITESIILSGADVTGVSIPATATVTRRFRASNCAFVTTSPTGTSFDVDPAAIDESEGFILNLCNLSGPGTPLSGIAFDDDEARILECRGVTNSTRVGELFWTGNTTASAISTSGTYVKAAGVSTAGSFNQRFDHTDNRLTYTSELTETFRVTALSGLEAGSSTVLGMRVYKNGVEISTYTSRSTTRSNNKAESVGYEAVVQLSQGDYLEVYVTNHTNTTDVVVEDLTFHVEQI